MAAVVVAVLGHAAARAFLRTRVRMQQWSVTASHFKLNFKLNFLFILTAFTGNFAIKIAHGTFQSFERMVLLYIGKK